MSYIGSHPSVNYQDVPSVQRFNGDGSDTTFTLNRAVGSVQEVLVSVDGVLQDSSAYTIPDGTTLTFSSAPSSGTSNIFVNYTGLTESTITPPNANKGNFKSDGLFRTNSPSLTSNTTILATENANATGPLTINNGVTLTINSGGRLVIL